MFAFSMDFQNIINYWGYGLFFILHAILGEISVLFIVFKRYHNQKYWIKKEYLEKYMSKILEEVEDNE